MVLKDSATRLTDAKITIIIAVLIIGFCLLLATMGIFSDETTKTIDIVDNSTEVWSNGKDYVIEAVKINNDITCYILDDKYNGDVGLSCVVNK